MTVYVFTGPTLAPEDGRAILDAVYLPPAGQGDVFRVARSGARAIGIIDGYFERVPAVWHKEILWAMSRGVHVFGSASMGALRAAELAPFGMIGVGAVYDALCRGELEDDDEVAVVHGPAESGYRALSEAMVNIRATLAAAATHGVIRDATRIELERLAKELFYAERSMAVVIERARASGVDSGELAALRDWLSAGRVDQKRLDALAMVRAMREHLDRNPATMRVHYVFEHTDAWEQFVVHAERAGEAGAAGSELELAEELALSGEHAAVHERALLRALALDIAERKRVIVNDDMRRAAAAELRRRHGLDSAEALEQWMAEQELDWDGLRALLDDEARLAWVAAMYAPDAIRAVRGQLVADGRYGAIQRRIRQRSAALAARGLDAPTLADAGIAEDELWRWYFETRLGCSVPADLADHARRAGFGDPDAMRRAVLRAFCHERPGKS